MTIARLLSSVVLALLLPLAAWGAEPGASDWTNNDAGAVRLVTATTAVGEAEAIEAGVEFRLLPEWKIYWRTPGDAGYPPKLDWSGSKNIGTPVLSWPAPKRFVLAGLQNHGYAGEVILPVRIPTAVSGRPVELAVHLEYLACSQVCVPMQADLDLTLPAGPAEPSASAHDLGRYRALVPGDGARHGLALTAVEAVGEGAASHLRLTVTAIEPFSHPDAFVEAPDVAAFEQPVVSLSDGNRRAVIDLAVIKGSLERPLAGAPLTVTVVDAPRSLEAPVTAVSGPSSPASGVVALAGMLAIALLGGFILNLMPCVLPVLSIKLLGALSHGGAEQGHVRAAFLASAAGIVTSFLALAAVAIGVKAAGQAVGWGIQFQQPGFLVAMVVLLVLFAANLWGVFEIPLPSFLQSGHGKRAHHTLLGHFLSGAFATLLATPCSAPFLGTAIGFALARGPLEIVLVFTALGLGMSIPYLIVAARPQLASRLPKPGRWMIILKRAMGLLLGGTAVWLLTVLAVQTGLWPALLAGGAMIAAVAMLVASSRLPPRSRPAGRLAAVALAAIALVAPFHGELVETPAPAGAAVSGIAWQRFDPAELVRLVSDGRTVFVDVTADWCITCKVNKAAVVERGEVARRLSGGDVVAMRADWTRPDDGISRYLASFGRYGIPFNAVYGREAPDGIALSELLSEKEVLAALDKAGGR